MNTKQVLKAKQSKQFEELEINGSNYFFINYNISLLLKNVYYCVIPIDHKLFFMRLLLGKTLLMLRRSKNLRQNMVADHMAVSRPTYSGWEKDRGCPSFLQVYQMIRLYNITMQELVTLVETDNNDS